MANLTEEKIFSAAEEIILNKGTSKITLTDIAKSLGVTHAAIYKHYKNKEDLLQKLALKWLDTNFKSIFEWSPQKDSSEKTALHDWLWLLTSVKKKLYQNDEKMFRLYTEYIETNDHLVKVHLTNLAEKVEEISGWKDQGMAVITAFTYFHNPYFADRWVDKNLQEHFEQVWSIVQR